MAKAVGRKRCGPVSNVGPTGLGDWLNIGKKEEREVKITPSFPAWVLLESWHHHLRK